MPQGIVNKISPTHEYTLADYTITAISASGAFFPLAIAGQTGPVESFDYDGKPSSKTVAGSGPNPRAHTRTIFKPAFMFEMANDFATKFEKFLGPDGICSILYARQAPGGKMVVDRMDGAKPLFGATAGKSGDASPVKITGDGLRLLKDTGNVI